MGKPIIRELKCVWCGKELTGGTDTYPYDTTPDKGVCPECYWRVLDNDDSARLDPWPSREGGRQVRMLE